MPLTEIAVATGALLTGIKAYRKYRRMQNINRFLMTENSDMPRPEDTPLASAIEEVKEVFYDFTQNTVMPIVERVQEQIGSRYPVAIRSVRASQAWIRIGH